MKTIFSIMKKKREGTKVNSILTLLLREGGVPVGGGGRWIHNPVIYKEIGTNIISPTTSVFDHSSFPKEENRVTIAYNYSLELLFHIEAGTGFHVFIG